MVPRIDDDRAGRFISTVRHVLPEEARVHATVVPLLIHAWIEGRVVITPVVVLLGRRPIPLLRVAARRRRTIAEYEFDEPAAGIVRRLLLRGRDHHRRRLIVRIEGRERSRLSRRQIRQQERCKPDKTPTRH